MGMVKGKVDENDIRMGKLKESENQISTMKVMGSKNEKGIVKEKESENDIRKATVMERKNEMAMLKLMVSEKQREMGKAMV